MAACLEKQVQDFLTRRKAVRIHVDLWGVGFARTAPAISAINFAALLRRCVLVEHTNIPDIDEAFEVACRTALVAYTNATKASCQPWNVLRPHLLQLLAYFSHSGANILGDMGLPPDQLVAGTLAYWECR